MNCKYYYINVSRPSHANNYSCTRNTSSDALVVRALKIKCLRGCNECKVWVGGALMWSRPSSSLNNNEKLLYLCTRNIIPIPLCKYSGNAYSKYLRRKQSKT